MLYILAYILLTSSFLYGAELNIKKRPRPDSEEVQESNKKIKTADSEYSDDFISRMITYYNAPYMYDISYKDIQILCYSYPEFLVPVLIKLNGLISSHLFPEHTLMSILKEAAKENNIYLFEIIFKYMVPNIVKKVIEEPFFFEMICSNNLNNLIQELDQKYNLAETIFIHHSLDITEFFLKNHPDIINKNLYNILQYIRDENKSENHKYPVGYGHYVYTPTQKEKISLLEKYMPILFDQDYGFLSFIVKTMDMPFLLKLINRHPKLISSALSDNDLLHILISGEAPLPLIKKVIEQKQEYLDILDSDTGLTPLHTAARYGTPELIEYLISQRPLHLYKECNCSLHGCDRFATPLLHAIQSFNLNGVITLLKYYDIKFRNSHGENIYEFLFDRVVYYYQRSYKDTEKFFLIFKVLYEANPEYAQENDTHIVMWKKLSSLLVPYLIEKKDFLLLNKIKFAVNLDGQGPEDRKKTIWNEDVYYYDKILSQLLTKYSPISKEINIATKILSMRSAHNIVLSCLHNNIPIPKDITESYAVNFHEELIYCVLETKKIPLHPISKVIQDFDALKKEVISLIKTGEYEKLQEYMDDFDEACTIKEEPYNDEDSINLDYIYKPYESFLLFVFSYEQLSKIIIEKLESKTQDAYEFMKIIVRQCDINKIHDNNNNNILFYTIKHDQICCRFNVKDGKILDDSKSTTLLLISLYPKLLDIENRKDKNAIYASLAHFPLFGKLFYDSTSNHYKMPNFQEKHDMELRKLELEKEINSWFNQDID